MFVGCVRPVVLVLVVQKWFDRPWYGLPVVPSVLVCWAWFRLRLVVPVWFRADVVRSCREHASVIHQPPNPPF
jgi:hypothetical protein